MRLAFDRYVLVGAVDLDGVPFCTSRGAASSGHADWPFFFRDVMEGGRFAVGQYSRGAHPQNPVLTLAAPVTDETGSVSGAVFAALDLGWLARHVEE